VDFRHLAPGRATVATYVYYEWWDVLEHIQETTQIRWGLVHRTGQWQIAYIAPTTWLHPLSFRDPDL
jgi:hypothetical protein